MKEKNKKDIGGYFELENFISHELYSNYIGFSSGRNCLLYIIKERQINKILLPYYLCDSVTNLLINENVEILYYHVDENFIPVIENEIDDSCYVYIVNYFGILNDSNLLQLKKKYKHVIFDFTHCFFKKAFQNVDTIYNCRKYFGVPDGAYLSTDLDKVDKYGLGYSSNRFSHLIGRYENTASDFYNDFQQSESTFEEEDLVYMSKLTRNLLGAINYDNVKNVRRTNFKYLHLKLKDYNLLSDKLNDDMDFMYPFMIENAMELRKILIDNHIYVPVLWPNVLENSCINSLEKQFVSNILFLPIDQRYDENDMDLVVTIILNYIKKCRR